MNRLAGLTLLTAAAASSAQAQGGPGRTEICVNNVVDREALANWILDEAHFSRRAEDSAKQALAVPAGASVRQAILATPRLCLTAAEASSARSAGQNYVDCTEGDADAFRSATVRAEEILRGVFTDYSIEPGVDRAVYFSGRGPDIACLGAPIIVPESGENEASRRSDWSLNWLRVRGSTESLNIRRGDPALAAETAASLVWSEDRIKDKSSEKIMLVAGVPIAVTLGVGSPHRFEIVPYFGLVRDITQERAKADVITGDAYQVGVAFNATIEADLGANDTMRHRISVRPDFMRNNSDTSEVGSLTAAWTPIVTLSRERHQGVGVNSFSRVGDLLDQEVLWTPLFDVRAVHGEFLSRGSRPAENSEDFTRLGTRIGIAFSINGTGWPLDLVFTNTYLASLNGGDDLNYLQGRLSLALHKDRLFTLDLTYGEGRKSDLDADEDGWKLSLGAKF